MIESYLLTKYEKNQFFKNLTAKKNMKHKLFFKAVNAC